MSVLDRADAAPQTTFHYGMLSRILSGSLIRITITPAVLPPYSHRIVKFNVLSWILFPAVLLRLCGLRSPRRRADTDASFALHLQLGVVVLNALPAQVVAAQVEFESKV